MHLFGYGILIVTILLMSRIFIIGRKALKGLSLQLMFKDIQALVVIACL